MPKIGYIELLRLLIQNGANVSAKDKNGNTPRHRAVLSNRPNIVLELLNVGADPHDKSDFRSKSPLDLVHERIKHIKERMDKIPLLKLVQELESLLEILQFYKRRTPGVQDVAPANDIDMLSAKLLLLSTDAIEENKEGDHYTRNKIIETASVAQVVDEIQCLVSTMSINI